MKDEELDKLFKERLEYYTVSPKKDIWRQIETRLDQERKTSVRKLGWLSYAAIGIGCLGLIVLSYYTLRPRPVLDMPILAHKEISTVPTNTMRESSRTVQPVVPVVKEQAEPPKQERTTTQTSMQHTSKQDQKSAISERLSRTEERHLELVELQPAGISQVPTVEVQMDEYTLEEYANRIPPVAPLIDSPETEESMLASARKTTTGIVPDILNKISDALSPTDNATIQFSKDEEGFLRVDIVNSFVKNRVKKRR